MSFEITFLGSSGGPIEGTNCSILLKPAGITYEEIVDQNLVDELVCIDAGSGLHSLAEIINQEQIHQKPDSKLLSLYTNPLSPTQYLAPTVRSSTPFKSLPGTCFRAAQNICKNLQNYLITHPHLDHINALVINSSSFSKSNPKQVWGSDYTIDALQTHVFNGVIWPKLNQFNLVNFQRQEFWNIFTINNDNYLVTMVDLSHGKTGEESVCNSKLNHINNNNNNNNINNNVNHNSFNSQNNTPKHECYLSSGFFITSTRINKSVLIFGDFESDLMSSLSKNLRAWKFAAPLIISKQLVAMVLECSNQNDLNEDELYGHLIPDHLIHELQVLESTVSLLRTDNELHPLKGFNIIINHIKEPPDTDKDPRQSILRELNRLNSEVGLGINFSIGLSGMSLII
ncbi:3',5'-cyclic-nucleotide phosphodiesterase (3':5'-CNP) [Scheffersomyces amazonensis]|uniref:3',5'-cyclic-nucleotide phosphodiesterase (3':5'-CNP) n=1 Tax=Scheffersomyces amazonensis TaxID=1078765 RepID=UPI00315D4843